MKKYLYRALAVFIAAAMFFQTAPVSGADENEPLNEASVITDETTVEENSSETEEEVPSEEETETEEETDPPESEMSSEEETAPPEDETSSEEDIDFPEFETYGEEDTEDAEEEESEYLPAYEEIPVTVADPVLNGVLAYPLPASYSTVTSPFGNRTGEYAGFHTGIDIAAPEGTAIYASMAGTVIISDWGTSQGNYVVIDHGNGIYTEYHHMSVRNAAEGESVVAGQVIGKVGSTGYATGAHLHFMLMFSDHGYDVGEAVDPYDYIFRNPVHDMLADIDLSSMRLLVGDAGELSAFREKAVSTFRDISLYQFDSVEDTRLAYVYFSLNAGFVEADSGISIAEGEAAENVTTDTFMTEEDNPLDAITETGEKGIFDIALIDTGADGADGSVSMIGGDGADDNGHGSSMLAYIKEYAPDARVLSIKALGSDGKGDVSAVYAAIEYAISQNVDIINLSLSALASGDSTVIEDAVNEAVAAGIIVTGAAGNNGRDAGYYVPGYIGSAYIIGAAAKNGSRLARSNYGESVDYNVAAGSTSEAAARFSGFIAANGIEAVEEAVGGGLIFRTDYEPEGDVNDDTDYLKEHGSSALLGEGTLYAYGAVRSTVTLADHSVGSLDELWADSDGDGLYENITAFNASRSAYAIMYGAADSDYFAAFVVNPEVYPADDFGEMIAAKDNDYGEVVSGVIFDPETGIAYIPKNLIDFGGEEYCINQIRVQTLYHTRATDDNGKFAAAGDGFYTPVSSDDMQPGYGVYELSAAPEVGTYTIVDTTNMSYGPNRLGGTTSYVGDDKHGAGGAAWVPDRLAENIITKTIMDNLEDIDFYYANNGYYNVPTWQVSLSSGTYELSNGDTITVKGGTYDLTCNHAGVTVDFDVDPDYIGPAPADGDYDAYHAGVYLKILGRDDDYLYIGLVTSSASGQAGAALVKVGYRIIEEADISFTIEREIQAGSVTVEKVLKDGSTLDPEREYSFSYWISPSSSYWGSATEFTLKAGETKTFDVEAGYYWKVEETDYSEENMETRVSSDGGNTWAAGRTITGQMDSDDTDLFPIWFATSSPNKEVTAVRAEGGEYTMVHNTTTYLPSGTYTINEGVSVDRNYRLMPGDVEGWTHQCLDNVDIWEGNETILATTVAGESAYIGTIRYSYQPDDQGREGEFRFENNKEDGSISLTKNVTEGTSSLTVSKSMSDGAVADRPFRFRVTIYKPDGTTADTRYNGTHSGVSFANGVGIFNLTPGESRIFTGIPAGDKYEAEEIEIPEGYEVTGENPKTGALGNVAQYDGSFDFEVVITKADGSAAYDISGWYADMYFENGVAEVSLRSGTLTAEGLPAGYKYSITETDSHGYKCSISNGSGTVAAGETAQVTAENTLTGADRTVAFINSIDTVPVTVIKKSSASDECTAQLAGNSMYARNFEGAEFRVTYIDGTGQEKTVTKTTGKDGSFTIDNVMVNTKVTAVEIRAPKGYALPERQPDPIVTTKDGKNEITVEDMPLFDPIGILIQKTDAMNETGTERDLKCCR